MSFSIRATGCGPDRTVPGWEQPAKLTITQASRGSTDPGGSGSDWPRSRSDPLQFNRSGAVGRRLGSLCWLLALHRVCRLVLPKALERWMPDPDHEAEE